VIATGFDHARSERSTPASAPMQTPVDMTAYSQQLRAEPAPSLVQPRATITRRPSLEVPLAAPKAMAVGQNGGDLPWAQNSASLPGEFDLNMDLDVPAFLRRNEG
jgi:hypothetical protein